MAKLTQYRRVPKPEELVQGSKIKVPIQKGSFFIQIGKQFYRRLQPTPWTYCKPDLKQLK